MQLRYYGQVIRQWFWMILLITMLCALTTWGISRQMTPVYQASTLVQVNGSGGTDSSSVFANQALAVSYALLITSNDVLQQVVPLVPGETLPMLQANVSASPDVNTQIIQVRATANTASQAAMIANVVAQVFVAMQIEKTIAPLQHQSDQLTQLMSTQKAQIDADQAQLLALQQANATVATIAHQRDTVNNDEATYNATLNNYQQVQLQLLKATSVVSLVQAAASPGTPISPKVTLNVLIATALALSLAVALAVLLDWLDTSLKTPEDVERLAKLTALGSLACYKQAVSPSVFVATEDERTGEVERDFMTLGRAVCCLYSGYQAILVTATGQQVRAGVTTVAAHLAFTLARMGKRVLLIDTNLRRPHLHTLFQRQNQRGLTNSLASVYHLREDIIAVWLSQWITAIPNLWCMPAGPVPTQPADLLRSQEFRVLMEWLSGQRSVTCALDFVIFDAPTLKEHADTFALAALASTSLLVVNAGKEQADSLYEASVSLERMGASVSGVILNRQRVYHHTTMHSEPTQTMNVAHGQPSTPVTFPGAQMPRRPADTPPLGIRGVEVGSGSRLINHGFEQTSQAAMTTSPQHVRIGRAALSHKSRQFARPLGEHPLSDVADMRTQGW